MLTQEDNILIAKIKKSSILNEIWIVGIIVFFIELILLLTDNYLTLIASLLILYSVYFEPAFKRLNLSGKDYLVIDENGILFYNKNQESDRKFVPWANITEIQVKVPYIRGNEGSFVFSIRDEPNNYIKLKTTEGNYIISLPWVLDKSTKEIKDFIKKYYGGTVQIVAPRVGY